MVGEECKDDDEVTNDGTNSDAGDKEQPEAVSQEWFRTRLE